MRFHAMTSNDEVDSDFLQASLSIQKSFISVKASDKPSQGLPKFDSSSSLTFSEGSQQSDDTNSSDLTEHQQRVERRHKYFQAKKKTEMCKTFQLGLVCPYGSKCSFAHGGEELKAKVLVPLKYKTTKCKQFFGKGCCNFGPRCQFLHSASESATPVALPSLSYTLAFEGILNSFNDENRVESRFSCLNNGPINSEVSGLRRLRAFELCDTQY